MKRYTVSIYNGTEWEDIFSSQSYAEIKMLGWFAYQHLREPHEDCVIIDASTGEILEDFQGYSILVLEEDM